MPRVTRLFSFREGDGGATDVHVLVSKGSSQVDTVLCGAKGFKSVVSQCDLILNKYVA